MKRNVGGDRLGSGAKMNVDLRTFQRSTHDLGRVIRTTMSPGTLVPVLIEPAMNGDTFDIDIDSLVRTMPTVGPLFGSFKLQIDVFSVPMRLYCGKLHMNLLGVGLDMKNIKLPKMYVEGHNPTVDKEMKGRFDNSSLLAYLGIRGSHANIDDATVRMKMNAVPLIAYYDIFKHYYANKQESQAFQIVPSILPVKKWTDINYQTYAASYSFRINQTSGSTSATKDNVVKIELLSNDNIEVEDARLYGKINGITKWWLLSEIGDVSYDNSNGVMTCFVKLWFGASYGGSKNQIDVSQVDVNRKLVDPAKIKIQEFDLNWIDEIKKNILSTTNEDELDIAVVDSYGLLYNCYGRTLVEPNSEGNPYIYNGQCSQNGLLLKTYNSDIFNNWVNTEYIDGENGVSAVSAIAVNDGKIKVDQINIAQKVYNMLNAIAVSGGTYQDWQEVVYGQETVRMNESPIYHGGMSREIVFEEVVSTAETNTNESGNNPLGSLAGKGSQAKKKGGNVTVKITEPSYIMAIASITPRIDYYQGNKWHNYLDSVDDLHKPHLDGIGFQNLTTGNMAYWDVHENTQYVKTFKSAGKQPAWLHYMTAVNEVFGDFADENKLMFMTLARRYEQVMNEEGQMSIGDLTTYINPSKFNYCFADTSLSAQNFWVQIGFDITARRKMSAKQIPQL